jgi:hypothetical protein
MRTYLAPLGSLIERRIGLVILFLAVGIPLLLALLGVGLFDDKPTPVILSEIATGPRGDAYVELYNDTDAPVDVKGWSVKTLSGTAELDRNTIIEPGSYLIVPSYPKAFEQAHPALAEAAAKTSGQIEFVAPKGALILYDTKGITVDAVTWPMPAPAGGPRPGLPSLVRRTQGLDSDTNGDWRAGPATPGTFGLPTIRMPSRIFLLEVTNYLSLIGGFLLWAAFVLMGLIARRFETLTGQRTFWQGMVIAPVGILIYNLIQANAFFARGAMTDCRLPAEGNRWTFGFSTCEQLWSFVPLFIAACVMAYVVYLFYRISRRILEV